MEEEVEFSLQAYCKMLLHCIKYPHASCSGFLLSPISEIDEKRVRIIEVMPVSHATHYLSPTTLEIGFEAIKAYAKDKDLIIAGYYQVDSITYKLNSESTFFTTSGSRIHDKIKEGFKNPFFCIVWPDNSNVNIYQKIDNEFRMKPSSLVLVDGDPDGIIYSKEKLYRQIVDFEDHLDDISLDWTNQDMTQLLDQMVC